MNNSNIVDLLIQNIKGDQALLAEVDTKIEAAKEEKKAIVGRLKEYQKDISVVMKYADDHKKKELEALGIEVTESEQGLNPVAAKAYDLIVKAKGNQLTNGELYEQYVGSLVNPEDAVN